MLYRITFLKAPWPEGAKVGDVIELEHVPAWALGKCEPAGDDAVATDFGALVSQGTGEPMEPAAGDTVTGDGSGESLPPIEAPTREAMEAEAKALGVSFNARTSDETLAARIAEAKAAK